MLAADDLSNHSIVIAQNKVLAVLANVIQDTGRLRPRAAPTRPEMPSARLTVFHAQLPWWN